MITDTITPKIELLQEQIDNIEKSGYYTEKEIDAKIKVLKTQLSYLKTELAANKLAISFEHVATAMDKIYLDKEVIDPEIMNPNSHKE
jgi:hypothetical protein